MHKLTVLTFGTEDFLEKYLDPLKQDCERHGYDLRAGTIPTQAHISNINHAILGKIVEYMDTALGRVLILDPECRIVRPIPDSWINETKPIVFQKSHYIGKAYEYDKELPCTFIGQPMFCSANDLGWMKWWYKAVTQMRHAGRYPPNETMLVLALKYNEVDTITKTIAYQRDYEGTYESVKGNWISDDVVIQHPCIHSALDSDVLAASQQTRDSKFLNKRDLHNHFQDYDKVKTIDKLMLKEITDVQTWPKGTLVKQDWYEIEQWLFQPSTGKIRHSQYNSVKYHHTMKEKIDLGIKSPAVKKMGDIC